MVKEILDFAVIGGGISGIYSAWRLKQQYPNQTVTLFEASDHIGGRLLSVRPPNIPNMVAELGGMRILPAVQPRIQKLIHTLNRQVSPDQQIELFDFPVDEPQNIAYLRGTHLRLCDFTLNPHKVPYHLSFLECGGTAGSLIIQAINQIVPGITNRELTETERRRMAQAATFAGRPLYQQGFWNVLMRIISNEAYQLSLDAGGYQSTLCNWNAADAIPWYLSDFGVDSRYKGFQKGFQIVPETIAELFQKAGGKIRLEASVTGFKEQNGIFELRMERKVVRAHTLILAMPRRALELLAPNSPPLQEIRELIASVTPRPLFKLFTTYTNPWWRAAGYTNSEGTFVPVESGRSLTDLPIGQTYYWPKADGTPTTGGPAMLMASYDDGTNIGFWDGLRERRGAKGKKQAASNPLLELFVGTDEDEAEPVWKEYRAPKPMVAEVARQLAALHGLPYAPEVRNAAFRDWGDDPFGGGWNSWNIGVKSWEVKQRIIKPFDGRTLFICGEAYSDAQGWVEGALQTADMMLEYLGLGPLDNEPKS